MAIGKRLDALLQAREIKPGTLASQTGINKNTIYAIIKRDSEKVNMSALHKIADALQVSIDYFFDDSIYDYLSVETQKENPAPEPSSSERDEITALFASLSDENQKRLLDYAQVLLKAQQAGPDSQG